MEKSEAEKEEYEKAPSFWTSGIERRSASQRSGCGRVSNCRGSLRRPWPHHKGGAHARPQRRRRGRPEPARGARRQAPRSRSLPPRGAPRGDGRRAYIRGT
ncbi:unnamed protein product [Prorocentrum cordatum]|uniref:Uncharacterized protein n=1 Tax=Prorocentrum cordatum TaxID=2364126 RepID=A0ABN9V7J5_9DINO|nr:unnamed protein product [Polarella glacialis]